MKLIKKIVETCFFLIGIVLFGFVIYTVGPGNLKIIFPVLHGWGWLVFMLYPFMCGWDVWGWRLVFPTEWVSKTKFKELFWVRLAGEALNNVTPIIDIGGEPLKVLLASKRLSVPKAAVLSSCVLSRTALLTAEVIFILMSLSLSFFLLPLSREWQWSLCTATLIFVFILCLFLFVQTRGFFTKFLQWIERLPIHRTLFEELKVPFESVDEEIARFYSHEKRKFALAVLFHTLGWISGGFEMMILCRLLGMEINWIQGVMLEGLTQLVRTASFFIPSGLGTQEAGLALFAQLLGHPPAVGVALSLLKRLRQILWTALGFLAWAVYRFTPVYKKIHEEKEYDVG